MAPKSGSSSIGEYVDRSTTKQVIAFMTPSIRIHLRYERAALRRGERQTNTSRRTYQHKMKTMTLFGLAVLGYSKLSFRISPNDSKYCLMLTVCIVITTSLSTYSKSLKCSLEIKAYYQAY